MAVFVGAVFGGMRGWGVHGDDSPEYEQLVKDGKVRVIAHSNPRHVATANLSSVSKTRYSFCSSNPDNSRV